jgi:hypothetical protein
MTEKVSFIPEGETETIDFYIVEQERLAGRNYLLVTDSEEGDGDALILCEEIQDGQTVYRIVEDDAEISAVAILFRDGLEEMGILLESL